MWIHKVYHFIISDIHVNRYQHHSIYSDAGPTIRCRFVADSDDGELSTNATISTFQQPSDADALQDQELADEEDFPGANSIVYNSIHTNYTSFMAMWNFIFELLYLIYLYYLAVHSILTPRHRNCGTRRRSATSRAESSTWLRGGSGECFN
jgi:hypothetical protein